MTKDKQPISKRIKELEERVDWCYSDEFSLDEATTKYKEAANLAKEIEKDLKNLENEISVIQKDFTKE